MTKNKMNNEFKITRLISPILLIVVGLLVAKFLIVTAPKVKKKDRKIIVPLVETMVLASANKKVVVSAMGTVEAAKEISLLSRVAGEVMSVSDNFIPGGIFKKGEVILQLDKTDYEIIVTQRKADLVKARSDYKLELGKQAIAIEDWKLACESKTIDGDDKDLVLRKPQLNLALARVKIAESALRKANLDLARTMIKSPFNAIVRSRGVEVGSQVSPQTLLAKLTGYDEYWVRTSIPTDKLKFIDFPKGKKEGSAVEVRLSDFGNDSISWHGQVMKRLVALESQGRMAQVLVKINNPLGVNSKTKGDTPLLIGSYVEVAIDGITLDNVYTIPRLAVRDGDTIWLLDEKKQLEIKPIKIIWRERDVVLCIDDVLEGKDLIVSNLTTPVSKMPLRILKAVAK